MKVLVIVDMQNDFIIGALGSEEAKIAAQNLCKKIEEYENPQQTLVLLTKDTHYSNYLETLEGINLPVPHCLEGTEGWSIYSPINEALDKVNFLRYSSNEIFNSRILKNTFGSEKLVELLKALSLFDNIEEIEICGVCTDICVVSNALALKMALPNVKIAVDAKCCAGVTPESHEAALLTMKSCQIEIR